MIIEVVVYCECFLPRVCFGRGLRIIIRMHGPNFLRMYCIRFYPTFLEAWM